MSESIKPGTATNGGPSATSRFLRDVLSGTAAAPEPRQAAQRILEVCVSRLRGSGGSVYTLDLSTGRFTPWVALPAMPKEGEAIPATEVVVPDGRISTVADFLGASPEYAEYKNMLIEGVVFYAVRNSTCVGAIRIDGPRPSDIDERLADDLLACADLLVTVYEDAFSFQLLESLQDPLDFTQSERQFFHKIADLIAESSGMEFVALREADKGALRCIALSGFDDAPPDDYTQWDLEPVANFPAFARALAGKTDPVTSIDDPEHAALRALPWCIDVKSFVAIPVLVGRKTFGVLSVGARSEYEYAPIELRGFESIANGVGVSISNYRATHQLNRQVGEYAAAASAITSIEVARLARHEAENESEMSTQALHTLQKKAGKACHAEVDKVEEHLHKVRMALKKMKIATAQPKAEWELVSVKDLWRQANTAVGSRLQEAKIDVRSPNNDVTVLARPDWLRQVFLNLLLNSIDAFNEARRRPEQRIDLAIDRPSGRDREYRLTYSDTAGGIAPQRLRVPSEEVETQELPVQQLVFEGGVTSKKDGSGYGLWLARKIIDDHQGSIDLVNYRNGIAFAISLPTPEEAKARLKEAGL